MKKYHVWGTLTVPCVVTVNAESEDDALQKAAYLSESRWSTVSNPADVICRTVDEAHEAKG